MNEPKYDPSLHIVLFEPEIPHNTGNIGRTCVALAAKLWLVRPLGFSLDDYYVRRAGLDYWELLDLEVVENWEELDAKLIAPSGRQPWLFSKGAEQSYLAVDYALGDIFVFGKESAGLPEWLHERYASRRLRLPMLPAVRSLNLSNTAAIVMYEALRQGAVPMP